MGEICLKSCSKNQWQEKLKLVCKQPQVANLSLFKSLYREVKLDQTGRERQFFLHRYLFWYIIKKIIFHSQFLKV